MILPHYPINWDAGQFALGQYHYDLLLHQPHPPGYFLLIMLARILTYITRNPSYSLAIISLIAGIFAVWLIYKLVLKKTDQKELSLITTLLLTFNPAFLYYSLTGLSYIFEPLTILALLTLTSLPLAFGFTLGILSGLRQSLILISLPLVIWQIWRWRKELKNISNMALGFALGFLLWFIPFLFANHGLKNTLVMILSQFLAAKSSPVYDLSQHGFEIKSLIFTLNFLIIIPFFFKREDLVEIKKPENLILLITLIWLPAVYFFTHFGDTGYLLGLVPVFILLCLPAIKRLLKTRNGLIILGALILIQLIIFFTNFDWLGNHKLRQLNYPTIRLHDQRLAIYEEQIRKNQPSDVMVVMLRGQYFGPDEKLTSYPFDDARPLAPYVPEYKIYDFLGVPGMHFEIQHDVSAQVDGSTIQIPKTTTKLLILADYINPGSYPTNLKLQAFQPGVSPYNYYSADISTATSFEFMGFQFKRGGL